MRLGHTLRIGAIGVLISFWTQSALAQLDENCTVSVLNRNVRVNPDGSWVLPNIPANFGPVKARATCVQNGVTTFGESGLFTVPANGAVNLPTIVLGATTPIPSSLSLAPANLSLTSPGQTIQLVVTATYPNNTTADVTAASTGTNYTTSNPAIAQVSASGLVTAVASGTVVIQATNDGASAIKTASVVVSSTDSDSDGIPDDAEISLGLDPHNLVDAQEDFDRDGLTNLREYQLGTDLRKADTDGDGLKDGDEVDVYQTSPLLIDTDADLIPDGVEVQTGSNPADKNSYDLKKAVASSALQPTSFVLTTSVLFPNASAQLSWKVNLIDGKTTLDLTADPRTAYNSSNLSVCNFGSTKGQVFAGSAGTCVITISNSTLSVTVSGTVQSFTPTALSFVNIPGFANNVDVNGKYAYVAAGSAGLQIVDVLDHAHPQIMASQVLPGNANDVIVAGSYAYVAAGSAGLQIVNIANPLAPSIAGSLNMGGTAWDVVVKGNRAYVAGGTNGLIIVDVSIPAAPVQLGSLALTGTAKGVDVDTVRQIAAVARGTNGLSVVNVANPASPTLLSTLAGGDVRDVVISGNFVFLADLARSFTSVDLANPNAPVLRTSTPFTTGGRLQDVTLNGAIAAGADVNFVNGVPLIDVSNPASPQPRFTLDFAGLRDDNGTGIAMDASYVYLTAEAGTITENGVNGTTRLYIGQYNNIQDSLGIPPTVQITSPLGTTPVIQGNSITVTANATDDVAVASVTITGGGQPIFTGSLPPYQTTYAVPSSATSLTFGATAVDFGNNIGTAPNIVVPVIPDPLTTANGRVVDSGGTPVAGATVSAFGKSASTSANGTFALSGLPTIQGSITVLATATVQGVTLAGLSSATPPVVGGITNVGDIRIFPRPSITGLRLKGVLAGTVVQNEVVTGANLNSATFSFLPVTTPPPISITLVSVDPSGTSANLGLIVLNGTSGQFVLLATTPAGTSDANPSGTNTITILTDPDSDSDSDGLTNGQEAQLGTDLLGADTDGDSSSDGMEVATGSDPLNAACTPFDCRIRGPEVDSVGFSAVNRGALSTSPNEVDLTLSVLNTATLTNRPHEADALISLENTGAVSSRPHEVDVSVSLQNTGVVSGRFHETDSREIVVQNTATLSLSAAMEIVRDRLTESGKTNQPKNESSLAAGSLDRDGDELTDPEEKQLGTDPINPDTDGDRYPDGLEVALGSNPFDPDSTPDTRPPGILMIPSIDIRISPDLGPQAGQMVQPAKGEQYVVKSYAPNKRGHRISDLFRVMFRSKRR